MELNSQTYIVSSTQIDDTGRPFIPAIHAPSVSQELQSRFYDFFEEDEDDMIVDGVSDVSHLASASEHGPDYSILSQRSSPIEGLVRLGHSTNTSATNEDIFSRYYDFFEESDCEEMVDTGEKSLAKPDLEYESTLKTPPSVGEEPTPCSIPSDSTHSSKFLPSDSRSSNASTVRVEEKDDLEIASRNPEPTLSLIGISAKFDHHISAGEQTNLRKRPRKYFEAVEIITPKWLQSKHHKNANGLQESEFLHPKWKIKRHKEDVSAGMGHVLRRVEALQIGPLPLEFDTDFLDFTVSREFVSDTYGGNPQETFPKISKEKSAPHNYRHFMFLNITYNPYAPQRPGYPGLFYRTHATELPKIHRVFIRVKDRVWLYIGQYELVRSESLTVQEWAVTSEQTKKKWASQISKQLWGQEVRTRIALRRSLRREPTAPELARAMGENIEDDEDVSGDSDKDSNGFVSGEQDIGSQITAEDVRHAFDKGDERIIVWVMKCVSYDDGFQREMIEKYSNWAPPSRSKPASAKSKGKDTAKPVRQPDKGPKSKGKGKAPS